MEMPDVECGGCARWGFLEETPFASIEEAKDKEFRCRMCEKVDAVSGMLEGTRRELAAERERLERLEAGGRRVGCREGKAGGVGGGFEGRSAHERKAEYGMGDEAEGHGEAAGRGEGEASGTRTDMDR
ncbi:hypothetical protein ISCGN_011392 [Ixodes scapularis]